MARKQHVNVIYEDNHILVAEKPVNIVSQADSTKDLDFLNICKNYIKNKYNKPGNVYLGLIHRLDRPVAGLMVFAKSSKAASRLSDQMRQRKIDKKYIAILQGTLNTIEDQLVSYIKKNPIKNISTVKTRSFEGAKKAILNYKLIRMEGRHSIVEVKLETGRPHQIRAQFSHIGHPILGDRKYGAKKEFNNNKGIALYSTHLSFKHPVKDEVMSFDLKPKWFKA